MILRLNLTIGCRRGELTARLLQNRSQKATQTNYPIKSRMPSWTRSSPKIQMARVACETLVKTGMVVLAGEITTTAEIDYEQVTRKVILDIGYDSSDVGFDGASCAVLNALGKQSPDIAMGVDEFDNHEQGAGDQGLMFGYASNETDVLMPAPITYAHLLVKKQAEVRKSGQLKFLRPDAKSQVTFRYDQNGHAQGIEAVVLSTQHDPDISLKDLQRSRHGGNYQARVARQLAIKRHQIFY